MPVLQVSGSECVLERSSGLDTTSNASSGVARKPLDHREH